MMLYLRGWDHKPAVQFTPHIQPIMVFSSVRKQDDLSMPLELCGHTHAQSEGPQVQRLQRNQLNITGTCLSRKHHGLYDNAP